MNRTPAAGRCHRRERRAATSRLARLACSRSSTARPGSYLGGVRWRDPKLLFQSGDLAGLFADRLNEVRAEVDAAKEDQLLQVDEQAWAASLAERYRLQAPVLRSDNWSMDESEEVQVDVSGYPSRDVRDRSRSFYYPGYRVVVRIPFDGPGELFFLHPSEFTLNPPQAVVEGGEVLHIVEYPHDTEPDIRGGAEELVRNLERWLGFVGNDVDRFNARLTEEALRMIQTRRERLITNRERLQQTGIPIRPRQGEAQQIEDVIVRRPAPVLPARDDRPLPLEPILKDDVFEHILGLIRSVGETMEKSPDAYAGMDEEARRQVFLPALNSHYHGQAAAEAFNVAGKTDIVVRFEGQNLFIAECKFWKGAKSVTEAIDQLFSYSSWRDTKLALIVFVRERDLTAIVGKAKNAIQQHSQFVIRRSAGGETEFRATMRWPGDDERLADLNVFLFQTAAAVSGNGSED